ncbi:MAG TPA: hypothetical protein DF698_05775 [Candidatus Atribacteria bacterium]|jgi:hypothetical protein|nr:hypothetical protein [Candidatus Atribacteria bacterium]
MFPKEYFEVYPLVSPYIVRPDFIPITQDFVGRKKELLFLERLLSENKFTRVVGVKGIGKTTLVSAYAQQQQAIGVEIFWFTARPDIDSLQSFLWSLASYLAKDRCDNLWKILNFENEAGKEIPLREKIKALILDLGNRNLLICIDNSHVIEYNKTHLRLLQHMVSKIIRSTSGITPNVKIINISGSAINTDCSTLILEKLTYDDFTNLCQKKGVALPIKIQDTFYRVVEGNPRYVTLLYNLVLEKKPTLEKLCEWVSQFPLRPEVRNILDRERLSLSASEMELMGLLSINYGMNPNKNAEQVDVNEKNRVLGKNVISLRQKGFLESHPFVLNQMPEIYKNYYQSLITHKKPIGINLG